MKRWTWVAIVAAAAVIGYMWWRSSKAKPAPGIAPVVVPSQVAPGAAVSNAFVNLAGAGANWVAQWFVDKVSAPPPGTYTTSKPPPVTAKGTTEATSAAIFPNLITTPTYFA